MKASICIATHNRSHLLRRTLESIYAQSVPFEFETIVVDDGPKDNATKDLCEQFPIEYHRIDREPIYRNPAVARNVGFRHARGEVIVAQSDEVVHVTPDCIARLVNDLKPGQMLFANVFCLDAAGNVCGVFTGPTRRAPFFFLGSLFRSDLYAVGGNDEDFDICPAWEDDWFGDCLTQGLGLQPVYTTHIVGRHLFHENASDPREQGPSKSLYYKKRNAAKIGKIKWESSGGPWPCVPGEPYKPKTTEEVFTAIHQEGHWAGKESASGEGSSLDATKELRKHLPRIIRELEIKSILDIPCGDWHWMRKIDLQGVQYIGADIVSSLVDDLQQHANDNRKFLHLDILSDNLPKVDLVFCRDCLVHFSHADVERALANISRSGSKYLMATTFPPREMNCRIQTGDWTPYNLQAKPFSLPEPQLVINEDCQEYYPDFNDKSMGLWLIEDLDRWSAVNSLIVCVEYDDFLAITLPRNKRHFGRTLVVTSTADKRTQELARKHGCECLATDSFYRDGAAFNKGAAVEEGFDILGRDGWICVWDADIVMPESISIPGRRRENLYVPKRRILERPETYSDGMDWTALESPTQPEEFDGYFQLFHASSQKILPWYSVDWNHAGGCDSDFQAKFPKACRQRAPFDVLHLGGEGIPELGTRVGRNWRGRVTPRIDGGGQSREAAEREESVRRMIHQRRYNLTREKIQQNRLERRIAFFWDGRMSWMRFMSLASFRRHNPDWEILLCSPAEPCNAGTWTTPEVDDSGYQGEDYRERLGEIGVTRQFFPVPISCGRAQASDMFQWRYLGENNGFYADMDILWVKPLESLLQQVERADAVFCLEAGILAIGFFAANKCRIFRDIAESAGKVNDYQGFGTELIRAKFGGGNGEPLLDAIRKAYPGLSIITIPGETVYPFDWREIEKIFEQKHTLPKDTCGLHWFGGSALAQKWNNILTERNYRDFDNTFTSRC